MDTTKFIEIFSGISAALIVIAGIPQAWRIWKSRSAENVSLLMWVLLAVAMGGFLLRSLVIVRDPVFLIQQAISEVINLFVIGEILYFRKRNG